MVIMSIHTRVITRTKNLYPIVHLVYHGNLWLIQSRSLYSLAAVGLDWGCLHSFLDKYY